MAYHTNGDREKREERKERERRENDSKAPLFSPSHRTPSRSTACAPCARSALLLIAASADTDNSRNAAFFGSAFVEYAELTEINAYSAICIGGVVYIFSTSAMQKIWLCTLFSTPLSFSPNTVSQTHRSSTIYFLTHINIFCYRLLFGRMS